MTPRERVLRQWRERTAWRSFCAAAVALFIAFHIGCTLARGLVSDPAKLPSPLFWYMQGFGLCHQWGMFARPADALAARVVGVTDAGEQVVLSPPDGEDAWGRYLRVRERKLRSSLAGEYASERFAPDFLRQYCEPGLRRVELLRIRYGEDPAARWSVTERAARLRCPAEAP